MRTKYWLILCALMVGLTVACSDDSTDDDDDDLPPTPVDASVDAGSDGGPEEDPDASTVDAGPIASADETPPSVLFSSPLDDEADVALNVVLAVFFNETMDEETLNATNFTLSSTGGGAVAGTVTGGTTGATFKPGSALTAGTEYTATLSTGVTDAAGNALSMAHSWSFTTATPAVMDTTPPQVLVRVPLPDSTGVPVGSTVTVSFDEAINPATLDGASFQLHQVGGSMVAGSVSMGPTGGTFTPMGALTASTEYEARIETAVTDLAGNALAMQQTWRFTTAAAADVDPPAVVFTSPAHYTENVLAQSSVTAFFSEDIDGSTVNSTSFSVRNLSGTPVPGSLIIGSSTVTFMPTEPFPIDTVLQGQVTTDVTDRAGNALPSTYQWLFRIEGGEWWTRPDIDGETAMQEIGGFDVAMREDGSGILVFVIYTGGMSNPELRAIHFDDEGDNMMASGALDSSVNNIGSPQVVFDSDGDIHVVYWKGNGTDNDIWHTTYDGTWQSPTLAVNTADAVGQIRMGIDASDNMTMIWQEDIGGPTSIFWSRNTGSSWTSGVALSSATPAYSPALAVSPGGDAIAGWIEPVSGQDSAYANRFTAGSWLTAQLLESDDSNPCEDIAVAVDSAGNAIVGWEQNFHGGMSTDAAVRRYDSSMAWSGAGWTALTMISGDPDGGNTIDLQVGIQDDGTALVAWVEAYSMEDWVFFTKSDSHAAAFESPEQLERSEGAANLAMSIRPGGRGVMGWVAAEDGMSFEFFARTKSDMNDWNQARNLGPARDMGNATIVLDINDDGQVITSWNVNNEDLSAATYH